MHIPDGLISLPINGAFGAVSLVAVGLGARRTASAANARPNLTPLYASVGAFIFAAQTINFPIGAGASGHMMGGALCATLLGGWGASFIIALVVALQAIGFADGGIVTMGTNIFNMAIVGAGAAYFLTRLARALLPAGRFGFFAAVGFGAWISLPLAAAAGAIELSMSGLIPWSIVAPALIGSYAVIGIGEAILTIGALSVVIATRPELAPSWALIEPEQDRSPSRATLRSRARSVTTLLLLVALSLAAIGGLISSDKPDGFEATIEANLSEREPGESSATRPIGAPLRDYTVPGIASQVLSGGLAGSVGVALFFALGFLAIRLGAARAK